METKIAEQIRDDAFGSVTPGSVALRRLIEEVRNGAVGSPSAYNRMHNRHNR